MKLNRLHAGFLALALIGTIVTAAHATEVSRVYDAHCALCHQRAGAGLPGQFPRLAGRTGEMSTTAEGRHYLIEVTLFGMAGKIEVDGAPIIGVMPGFAILSSEDIASALNYVIGLDGPTKSKTKGVAVTAADVERVRQGSHPSPTQVRANRDKALAAVNK